MSLCVALVIGCDLLRYCICDRPGPFDAQFFFAFFLYGRETALQNDAICSDVTRSTRAVYAQIARVAVERDRVIRVQSLLPVKIPRLRICVIPCACA